MVNVWQLQEPKNKFSSLVGKAHHDGPQLVKRHDKESVVVIAVEDYLKLNKPKPDLLSFFKSSPLVGMNIDLTRGMRSSRDVAL